MNVLKQSQWSQFWVTLNNTYNLNNLTEISIDFRIIINVMLNLLNKFYKTSIF